MGDGRDRAAHRASRFGQLVRAALASAPPCAHIPASTNLRKMSHFQSVAYGKLASALEIIRDYARNQAARLHVQELPRKLARYVAVERYKVPDPKAEENREQQQRVFRRLSELLRLLDQRACLLKRCFGLGRRIAFGVHQSVCEPNLKPDLRAAQRGRAG
jgi:hypothetical protein